MKLLLFTLVCLICSSAQAVELMKWERVPLPIRLNIGQERIIFVERNVRVGYPPELEGKLRIQSTGGTVYLLAIEPIASTRLQFRDIENGEVILLNVITGTNQANLEPIKLVYDEELYKTPRTKDPERTSSGKMVKPKGYSPALAPIPVILTRYAAQNLYAPLRTAEPLPGVQQIALRLPATITTLLPSEPVKTMPLSAWQLDDFTVTAIKLMNTSSHRIQLDPRALQGKFYSATFQHNWLGAAGTPEDTSVVYLITKGGAADKAITPEPVPVPSEDKNKKRRRGKA